VGVSMGAVELELEFSDAPGVSGGLVGDRHDDSFPLPLSGEEEIRPSFIRFFCFIRRFWNQIFT
jgi:hypothetical protein